MALNGLNNSTSKFNSSMFIKVQHFSVHSISTTIFNYNKPAPSPLGQLEAAAAARLSWMLSWRVSFERREDCFW
jgi:hypothetical protein